MHSFRIAVFPGDGIGAEVMVPCVALLTDLAARSGNFHLQFQTHEAGAGLYRRTGVALPPEAMISARQADAILLGAMGLPDVRQADGRGAKAMPCWTR